MVSGRAMADDSGVRKKEEIGEQSRRNWGGAWYKWTSESRLGALDQPAGPPSSVNSRQQQTLIMMGIQLQPKENIPTCTLRAKRA